MSDVKRAKAVDAKLVWAYETMLVRAADYDALAAEHKNFVDYHHKFIASTQEEYDRFTARVQALEAEAAELTESYEQLGAVALSHVSRVQALEAALTPSAETKGAYMGEFTMDFPERGEDGDDVMRRVNVPWTTIKTIMAAILARADGEQQ